MLNSNQPVKVAHFQKLANQSVLNGAFVIEMVHSFFTECNKNFCCLIKYSHKKEHRLEIWVVKLRFLLSYENMLKSIATTRSECTGKH